MLLLREARTITSDIDVISWGHYYRTYSKMTDSLANIAIHTVASIKLQASSDHCVFREATAVIDSDVKDWLEISHIYETLYRAPQ